MSITIEERKYLTNARTAEYSFVLNDLELLAERLVTTVPSAGVL